MTPGVSAAPSPAGGLLAFYRLQARLMWTWRPTRLAMLRRTVLSYLGACLALIITASVLRGLRIDGPAALLIVALLLLALDSCADVLFQWLFVSRAILVAQTLGLLVQFLAILAAGRAVPRVSVDGDTTAVWAAVLLTILNSLFAELVAVSDDDSYYGVLVRRLVARNFKRAAESTPGLLVVQVDGLSLPVLRHAMRAGRVPVLGGLVRDGAATLHPWVALLPPTTPASQAGILYGRNDGVAGFRWYEKATARLLVANHPDDAAEIARRVSDGTGVLADDGASIGNLLDGDAPRSYLTMATIGEGAPSDDARRLRGFLATSVNYLRLLVLMVGEMAKELYQAERQRARSVEPRMHRDLHYAVERAVTNIALRTTSTAFVIEEMYGGAPTIYVDYTGYDAIAHHCGPERQEAIDALEGIDRAIGSLLKASQDTCRAYRLIVLSDHGQCLGATFSQRHGQPLEAIIAALLPGYMSVVGTTDSVESAGMGRRIVAELGRGQGVGSMLARLLPGALRRLGRRRNGPAAARPDVVVASSGSLAHVYFTSEPGRMTAETIEVRYPGLIEALARHPGIGAVLVRSDAGHAVVLGQNGRLDLTTGRADPASAAAKRGGGAGGGAGGGDPLADYGTRAAENLLHLEAFANAGDVILLGAVDRVSGEVTGFEELIGSHGGLGGWQSEPFIMCPATLTLAEDPPVGAPAIYRQLVAWQAQLRTESGG
ncbi:MAG: phage holin family protein [Candidatus Limnocylindrales bacterium]